MGLNIDTRDQRPEVKKFKWCFSSDGAVQALRQTAVGAGNNMAKRC